jgi:cbb3-type cytochrome oxidase subunit 3
MAERKLSELTDEELLQEAKKMKSNSIMNAVLIGFFVGVIVYSVVKNTIGLVTLIPIFFVYRLVNKSNYNNQELERLLKERNLK